MKRYIIVLCSLGFFLTLVLLSSPTYAEECSPFQLSLWSPIQLVPKEKVVCGVRLNLLAGDNAEVWGLDAGLVNITGAFKGLQIGGVNWGLHPTSKIVDGRMSYGVQLGGIENIANMTGVQGGLGNYATNMTGVQVGIGNVALNMTGVQVGLVSNADNMTGMQISIIINRANQMRGVQIALFGNASEMVDSNTSGVQIGLINITKVHMTGVQIGLINTCKYLTGVQIGLINIAYSGEKAIPFLPLINIGFY